jgi:GNAT superfamily N-acetyltransferase
MIPDVVIKVAQADDAEGLSQLALRSKGYWGYDPDFLKQCQAELTYTSQQLESKDYFFAKAVDVNKHQIVGFYALAYSQTEVVELEALFIEPRFIGCGFGSALLRAACEKASQQAYTTLVIQGDPNAESFYLKHNAKRVKNRASGSISGRFLPIFHLSLQ